MREKATGATLDWSERDAPTRRKPPPPFGFRHLEHPLTMPIAVANYEGLELDDIIEGLRYWGSSWNRPTNTSGTIPVIIVSTNDPDIDYVCGRNIGGRPWLDELCRIRPTIIELFEDLYTTAPALASKVETSELQKPPTVVSRRKEIEWLSSNARNLRKYEGKWIALEGDKIVASGSDEVAVEMRARMKGIKVPFLIRVPSKEDMLFIGHSLHDSNGIR